MKGFNWEDYSFVVRGQLRRKVVLGIQAPITPKELSKKLEIHLSEASRALLDLTDAELAICLTPDQKTGRVYDLTPRGKAIQKKLLAEQ